MDEKIKYKKIKNPNDENSTINTHYILDKNYKKIKKDIWNSIRIIESIEDTEEEEGEYLKSQRML